MFLGKFMLDNINFLLYSWRCYFFSIWKLSYAIGISEPISITVFSYNTSEYPEERLLEIINNNFDLRPGKIVK